MHTYSLAASESAKLRSVGAKVRLYILRASEFELSLNQVAET